MAIFRNPFTQTTQPGNPQGPGQRQQQGQQQQQPTGQPQNQLQGQNQNQGGQGQNLMIPEDEGTGNGQNNNGQQNNAGGTGNDPMLQFDKLWDNPVVDPNDPTKNQVPENKGYLPKLDPAKLQEFVGKMDFTKDAMTPELMAAIQAGGDGATNAMMTVINSATQRAMLTAFQASQKLMETGLTNAETGFLGKVPDHVKDMMVKNSLTSSNPIMQDPAYGPLVEVTRQRYQTQYPKATPAQIESAVNKYFDGMSEKLGAKKAAADNPVLDNTAKLKTGAADADWDAWAGDEIGNIFSQGQAQQMQG